MKGEFVQRYVNWCITYLTQDTYGKVTNSQLDSTNESHKVNPFPAGSSIWDTIAQMTFTTSDPGWPPSRLPIQDGRQ